LVLSDVGAHHHKLVVGAVSPLASVAELKKDSIRQTRSNHGALKGEAQQAGRLCQGSSKPSYDILSSCPSVTPSPPKYPRHPQIQELFVYMDANHDGTLELNEAR